MQDVLTIARCVEMFAGPYLSARQCTSPLTSRLSLTETMTCSTMATEAMSDLRATEAKHLLACACAMEGMKEWVYYVIPDATTADVITELKRCICSMYCKRLFRSLH